MGWLKRLLGGAPEAQTSDEPAVYDSPWHAVQGFIRDPQWQVEILEERPDQVKVRFGGIVGELFDDPDDRWLQIRFRDPFTETQRNNELERYVGWSHHCAQHTLFRWDIDEASQEYVADAFALFEFQFDSVECIRAAFNSAELFTRESNKIALSRMDYFAAKKKAPSVALALWDWMSSPLAPQGTKIDKATFREESYWMGSALGSVKREQWLYYAVLRFGAGDYMAALQEGPDTRLRLYKMHLHIQRWFPHVRNFVLLTPTRPETDGTHEFSISILVASGTNADGLFDVYLKEVYENLREYTEWFHFDFTPETAPWFDHSKKKPQTDYTREFSPRPVP